MNCISLCQRILFGLTLSFTIKGAATGEPRAVNVCVPGVTSPGWGGTLIPTFTNLLATTVGGAQAVKDMIHGIWKLTNPGLVYADVYEKGFSVVKHTKKVSYTEYFHITPTDILTNYTAARAKSGNVTASFHCGGSFVTEAKKPGSLVPQSCGAIKFDSKRPAFFDMTLPAKMTCDDVMKAKFSILGKTRSCKRLSMIPAADRQIICANSINAATICPVSSAALSLPLLNPLLYFVEVFLLYDPLTIMIYDCNYRPLVQGIAAKSYNDAIFS